MKVPKIPEGVCDLDRSSAVPLSQQIYRALREAVGQGRLKAGMRLPSSRSFAHQHAISRNTVNAAYELLKAEGIVEIRPGAAPVVVEGASPEGSKTDENVPRPVRGLSDRGRKLAENLRGDSWGQRHGALQPGAPALDAFPYELWARCLRRAARTVQTPDLLYQNISGYPPLKKVLAEYLASERGVRASPDQVLIVPSMQAALAGISAALSDPGDTAWIEDPGYMGARTAFYGAGLNIKGLPVDEFGVLPESLFNNDPSPRLIYVTPSHQYPFGARMPLARRLALIEAAAQLGATVLEDDYDSEFLFEGRPVAALQGLADAGEVIYMGTFSKSLLPGLRVSYVVVPKDLAGPLGSAFRNMGQLVNVHAQIALTDFIDSGHYRAHLKKIRTLYQQRGLALVGALKERLGNKISVDPPLGNVQVTVRLNEDLQDLKIARAMQARGYSVSPLSVCYLDAQPKPGLIIGFAGASDAQIQGGVSVLKEVLNSA
ncbi:PLP-dependent aminotransferase family protein [Labrenzia sp. PHM005]|uniref:MocR-like pyridoxine biosynthesis transcription factor PdxR n=1 Tax=Labrenzia sp. PHM005 TaxID=2590016 RepID=UPI00113FEE67|nr:PLP-dependent aminotransferase family protein [Labrenzia sp. PHM005]QDG76621.1 PLP-dependent aminotransferase family protein [Labrenzia sp. PHM005]